MPRSYDSSKEDAQNPWPDYEESPPGKKESPPGKKESPAGKKESPAGKKESPEGKKESRKRESAAAAEEMSPTGKRAFQSGKAGKQPLRTDSMQTEVQTPPPKLKRANTSELTGSTSKKVKHALTRPQTVDKTTAIERKASAEAAQKKLQQEFDDVEDTQQVDDPKEPASDPAPKPASPRAKSAAKAKPKAAAATKSAAKSKAAPKTTSKAKARAAPSPSDDEPNNSSTAGSSTDPPLQPKPARSPKKQTKPQSPAKPKPGKSDSDDKEDEDPSDRKKKAHKLYMRFYRSIHSHGLRFSFLPFFLSLSLLSGLETLLQSEDLKNPGRCTPKEIKSAFEQSKYCNPFAIISRCAGICSYPCLCAMILRQAQNVLSLRGLFVH